jgi:TolB-like protein
MKARILSISLIIALICAVPVILHSQGDTVRFAISPFVVLTADAEKENAGSSASKEIESSLCKNKWFEMRTSDAIGSFLEKLALAQSGAGDVDAVTSMGKDLKIDYLTVGSVSKFGSHYEVDSRSVDINTWMIVHSAGCSAADLGGACNYINKDVEITLTRENLDERLAAVKDKPTLAVFRFNDANEFAQEIGYGGAFSEVLNSELGARNDLAVMERTHLKAVIDAKTLEMCGVVPNDDSDGYFAVRGIAYKFEGTIKLYPDVVCIGYQVLNTANSRRIYMGYAEVGSVKGLRPLARKLAREIDESINRKIGTVEIKTVPRGADVNIDGQPYGKTPSVTSLMGGAHTVKVSLGEYETVTKGINVVPGKVITETIALPQLSRTLLLAGLNEEQRKKWKSAIAKYEEFITKYGDANEVNEAYYRKGHVLLNYLNDYEGALKVFEALIARYPDSMTRAEAYFGIARAYKEMGKPEKVKETVQILRDKFPAEIATEEANAYFGM